MRNKIWILLLIIFAFYYCQSRGKSKEEDNIPTSDSSINDSLKVSEEQNTGIPREYRIFELIRKKRETPERLPYGYYSCLKNDFNYSEDQRRFDKLDTGMVVDGVYCHFTHEDFFLYDSPKNLSCQIYYATIEDQFMEKIVRITRPDTIFDIKLSAVYETGKGRSFFFTEFENDSILRQASAHLVTKDSASQNYNTIIKRYLYDQSFNRTLLSVDTASYTKVFDEKYYNLKLHSKPFSFLGKNCIWEYVIEHYEEPYDKDSYYEGCFPSLYKLNLLEYPSRKIIMNGMGLDVEMWMSNTTPAFFENIVDYKLLDVNFDGHDDILIYNNTKSTEKEKCTDSYVFNPQKGIYEFAEDFSGYNLSVDKKKKKLHHKKRNSFAEDFPLYVSSNMVLTHEDSVRLLLFWKKEQHGENGIHLSVQKIEELCDISTSCRGCGLSSGSVFTVSDNRFKIYYLDGEYIGAARYNHWWEAKMITATGHEINDIKFHSIKEIHQMPDGKYLILSSGISQRDVAQLAYLFSLEGDSIIYHPFEFNYPGCLNNYYASKEKEYIVNFYGPYSLILENMDTYIFVHIYDSPYLKYDSIRKVISYQYDAITPMVCDNTDSIIYRHIGELKYINGTFKQIKDSSFATENRYPWCSAD